MAIETTEQTRLFKKAALEPRTNVGTIADMHAILLGERYNGLIVTVRTTGERYELLYDGDFEALSEAAKDTFLASNGNWTVLAAGLSAYDIWLEEGNVGTKQDFLDSLQGDSFNVDAQGLLTGLSAYDAELKDFAYLATDTGNLYIKNSDTSGDWSAPIPFRGPQGQSAYQVWIEAGNTGNVQDYIDSLKGDQGISAYQVAVNNGFVGTESAWLLSLKGEEGKSAYQVWLDEGNEGTVQDYLNSLKGEDGEGQDGLSAYEVAVANGYQDTEAAWLLSLKGAEGDTAYEVWLAAGNTGSVQEYLDSLKGEDGESAYQVAVNNGFEGTEAEWLESLKGDPSSGGIQSIQAGANITIDNEDPQNPEISANFTAETPETIANKYESYDNVRRFTAELKAKVDQIITNGDGTLVLFNDGTYKLYRGLPDPATHAGKFLKTNGTVVSYQSIQIGDIIDLSDELADKEDTSNKNVAGGYVGLDPVTGKIDPSLLPDQASIYNYVGNWDASTGNPPSVTPNEDDYWIVNVPGSTNLSGITDWDIGDWAIWNGSAWEQRKNTNQFTDINGQTSGSVKIDDSTIDHAPTGTIPAWIAGIYSSGKAKLRAVLNNITSQIQAMKNKLDNIEENAKDDQTKEEIRDLLQSLTNGARLDASAIKNLNVGLLVLENNITYTVGPGGNFATLNAALGAASIYKPTYDSLNQQSYTITIRLLPGFVLKERINLVHGDWAFVKITSKNNDVIEDIIYDAEGNPGSWFRLTSCVPPDLSDLSVIMDRTGVNEAINPYGINIFTCTSVNWTNTKIKGFRINLFAIGLDASRFSSCDFDDSYGHGNTPSGVWVESTRAYFLNCTTRNAITNNASYPAQGIRVVRNSYVELRNHISTGHTASGKAKSASIESVVRIVGGDFRLNGSTNSNKDIVVETGAMLTIGNDVLGGVGFYNGFTAGAALVNRIAPGYMVIDERADIPVGSGGVDREELEYTSIPFASSIDISIPADVKHIKRHLAITGDVSAWEFTGLKNGDRGSIYVSIDNEGGHQIASASGFGEFKINELPGEITELTFEYNGNYLIWRSAPVVEIDGGNQGDPNQPPTSNAGSDIEITLPTNSTQLNGSGSDSDGTITYAWTQQSGPDTATISNASIANPTVFVLIEGVYVFRLTVTDDDGATDFDDITVTVSADPAPQISAQSIVSGEIIVTEE